jgi:hypothetical protein
MRVFVGGPVEQTLETLEVNEGNSISGVIH